jgi:tyrosine-protein kinase Etk/Wzc
MPTDFLLEEPAHYAPEPHTSDAGRAPAPHSAAMDFVRDLGRHKRFVAAVTAVAMGAGVVYSLTLPVLFTATTRILTPQQAPSSAAFVMSQLASSGAGALAAAAGAGLGLHNPNDIYIGLLQSEPVADAILEKFGLAAVYKAKYQSAARAKLAENTQISSEKSGFIAISVTDRDPQRAASIANTYTGQLLALSKSLAVTEASQRRLFYEDQLKHAKDDLVAAQYAFQQIQRKKGLVQLDAQARAVIGNLSALRATRAAKQVELDALRSYSTERNPQVELAERQLQSLTAEETRLERTGGEAGSADLGLQQVADAGMDYLTAEHELQYRQVMFDLLLKQFDAAKLDEAKTSTVVQVVEKAAPPDRKSSPHRASIVFMFTVLGLLAACSYLFVCQVAARLSAAQAGTVGNATVSAKGAHA